MSGITLLEVQLVIAIGLFVCGVIALATGMIVLVVRSSGKEVRVLADQTSQLAKKGLAEDVAGLVGNTSALLSATTDLIRTTAGIGVFLSIVGFLLMAVAAWLTLNISQFGGSIAVGPALP